MKWQIDSSHTSIGAKVKHMMVSTVRGSFAGATGTIEFDPAVPDQGSIELRIPAASIDTGDERRDGHLKSADFLDAENHPEIVFTSTKVKSSGKDTFLVDGDLTIRGVTKPATVNVELAGIAEDVTSGRRAAFDATASIDRTQWGLVWNMPVPGGLLVSEKIVLEASVAATPVEVAATVAA